MTMAQQFPDISETLRLKNRIRDRNVRSASNKQSMGRVADQALTKYYEREFRKWHIKFLFIVAATLGVVYFILLKSFWIYNLFNVK
jgi:hypothetical protein